MHKYDRDTVYTDRASGAQFRLSLRFVVTDARLRGLRDLIPQ